MIRILILLSVVSCGLAEDKKWVWGGNDGGGSTARAANDYLSRPRPKYEISEFVEGVASHAEVRPQDFRPPVDYDNRPYNRPTGPAIRPGNYGTTGPRPGGVYNQGGFGQNNNDQGNYGQGAYGQGSEAGILTGPVPSWQKEPPIKEFDKCKCTEKFNCNSPGISYGHCDVGKQYCCYNSQGNALAGGPIPNRPVHSLANGVLSGPGGPVDYIPSGGAQRPTGSGYRPNQRPGPYDFVNGQSGGRPQLGGRPQHGVGVLVGPGGPTGIIGRPTGNGASYGSRPINNYSPQNGILTGPSGGYDSRPYGGSGSSGPSGPYNSGYGGQSVFGLGRSANIKDEQKDIKE